MRKNEGQSQQKEGNNTNQTENKDLKETVEKIKWKQGLFFFER